MVGPVPWVLLGVCAFAPLLPMCVLALFPVRRVPLEVLAVGGTSVFVFNLVFAAVALGRRGGPLAGGDDA